MFFKYRGNIDVNNEYFIRDIEMIVNDEIWCSPISQLNDPTEASFSISEFEKRLKLGFIGLKVLGLKNNSKDTISNLTKATQNLMLQRMKTCGVFSVSKTINSELMWAHYGNSHKGYCIEYEFSVINEFDLKPCEYHPLRKLNEFRKVQYSDTIFNHRKLKFDNRNLLDFLFHKSKSWQYEEEYRIITALFGKYKYNPKCLKSITFGVNMNLDNKNYILDALIEKDIKYYQMYRAENEYKFYRKEI